jgi:peroxiredoxin
MTMNRSRPYVLFHRTRWTLLLVAIALAACNRAPTPPEKLAIAPASPGTATGFAILRQSANADRNQEASDNRFTPAVSYIFVDADMPSYYVIALLEKPVDNQKLAEAIDPSDVIEDAMRDGANGVVLMADGDGGVSGSFEMRVNGKDVQFGGSGSGGVRALVRNGNRVTGHIHYFNSFFSNHMAIDASFDAELLQPPKGTPLPPDGGEAAEAYRATIEAMRAGDVDALVAGMAPERAEMIEAERNKPDFAEKIGMLKAMAPDEVEVTGGTSYGERVVLTTKGKDGEHAFTGTVEMNWEEGGWRMGKQSQRMGGSSDGSANADAPTEPKAEKPPTADLVPVLADDGAACKGFKHNDTDFNCSDGFAVSHPDLGEDRILVFLSPTKTEMKGAKALWTNDLPLEGLFADGMPQPTIWIKLARDEDGELATEKVWFVDAEGNMDDTYLSFSGIESQGKVIGWFHQSGMINDVDWEGLGRFNLPVVAVP